MRLRLLAVLLPITLAACSPRTPPADPVSPAPDAAAATTPPAAASKAAPAGAFDPATAARDLGGFHWTLDSAVGADGKRVDALFPGPKNVLRLDFADGRVAVSGSCNGQNGTVTFGPASQLAVGPMRATMMACDAPLMAADQTIAALLTEPQQIVVLDVAGSPPRLELKSATGMTTSWIGTPTAQTRHGGPGKRMFLEVAPQQVDCPAPTAGQAQCLSVREIRFDDNGIRIAPPGEWRPLAEPIEGFTFVPGTRNVLRLDAFGGEPGAPAAYVLDMVVESGS